MGVDWAHPVAIRNSAFCVVCSLLMCVLANSGAHAVCEYVRTGRVGCLYIVILSSLKCANVVCFGAHRIFKRALALFDLILVCFLYVLPRPSVTLNAVGFSD